MSGRNDFCVEIKGGGLADNNSRIGIICNIVGLNVLINGNGSAVYKAFLKLGGIYNGICCICVIGIIIAIVFNSILSCDDGDCDTGDLFTHVIVAGSLLHFSRHGDELGGGSRTEMSLGVYVESAVLGGIAEVDYIKKIGVADGSRKTTLYLRARVPLFTILKGVRL